MTNTIQLSKANLYAAYQQATDDMRLTKANKYVVYQQAAYEEFLTKAVKYVAYQQIDAKQRLTKATKYVVYQKPADIRLSKATQYAVYDGQFTGHLYQDVGASRPIYREATTTELAHIDLEATGAEFKINIYTIEPTAVYTIVYLKPDSTFGAYTQTMTTGPNTLNQTENFNQLWICHGDYLLGEPHRYALDSIKKGMLARLP